MAAEAIEVVVAALAAGGVAGVKDTASAAVKDAYAGLLGVARHRFGQQRADELRDHPESLTDALAGAQLNPDDELVTAAQTLLAHLKYTVDARGAQGVQIGDHNTMTLHLDGR
jgi:hypothetical protein